MGGGDGGGKGGGGTCAQGDGEDNGIHEGELGIGADPLVAGIFGGESG